MKVFVAAKWEEKSAARALMTFLEEEGHEVTHDWTQRDPEVDKPENLSDYMQKCAMEDYDGVVRSEALVMLCHNKGKGMFVEQGIAIAEDIPVLLLDREQGENVYCYMPNHFTLGDRNDVAVILNKLEEAQTSGRVPSSFKLVGG